MLWTFFPLIYFDLIFHKTRTTSMISNKIYDDYNNVTILNFKKDQVKAISEKNASIYAEIQLLIMCEKSNENYFQICKFQICKFHIYKFQICNKKILILYNKGRHNNSVIVGNEFMIRAKKLKKYIYTSC